MAAKKTILLIDDEVDLVDMVKFQLIAKGYNVVAAHDGLEGLEKLKNIKPDLIILDINMPKMGGLEFYGRIATEHGRSKYPVLVLTARANLEKTFKDINVDGFMPKPFEIDQLIKEVGRITSGETNPIVFLIDFVANPHVQKIKEILESQRYRVIVLEGIVQVMTAIETTKPHYILLEYMQKDVNGEEFLKRIKSNPLFNGIPIVVYSYSGFKEYEAKSLAAGADRYLGKPDDYGVFVKALKEMELERGPKAS